MLSKLRQGVANKLSVVIDAVEIGVLVLGTGVSLVFGKILAAVVFVLLAAGVARRFFRPRVAKLTPKPLPVWTTLVIALLSVVETAMIVEAINLPVRFDHAGFDKSNLLVVVALLIAFYCIQRSFARRIFAQRAAGAANSG